MNAIGVKLRITLEHGLEHGLITGNVTSRELEVLHDTDKFEVLTPSSPYYYELTSCALGALCKQSWDRSSQGLRDVDRRGVAG